MEDQTLGHIQGIFKGQFKLIFIFYYVLPLHINRNIYVCIYNCIVYYQHLWERDKISVLIDQL